MFSMQEKNYPDLLQKKTLTALLKPISKAEPSGVSLRYENEYDQVQKARKIDEDLPQGVWSHDLKEAQWDDSEKICLEALKSKSKDIQISLWLTEAWFHQYQSYGLKSGLDLTSQILKKFWSSFHPFSADDPEYRVSPILWFDRELTKALGKLVLAFPEDDPGSVQTFWDYQTKVLMGAAKHQQTSSGSQGQKSLDSESFYKAVKQTPTEFYKDLVKNLEDIISIIKDIESQVESKYKDFPGCLMHMRGRLEKIHHFSKNIYKNRTSFMEKSDESDLDVAASKKSKGGQNAGQGSLSMVTSLLKTKGSIQNRTQAYELLNQIADYLAQIEPHSPTPYLIRRAVSWGDMSLGELMSELAQQSGDIQHAMRFLGMDRKDPPA